MGRQQLPTLQSARAEVERLWWRRRLFGHANKRQDHHAKGNADYSLGSRAVAEIEQMPLTTTDQLRLNTAAGFLQIGEPRRADGRLDRA